MAAAEVQWRAEHDRRIEAVMASVSAMVKGQFTALTSTTPLPGTAAAQPPAAEPAPAPTLGNADTTNVTVLRAVAAA